MIVTAHCTDCAAIKDPEATCRCYRAFIRATPSQELPAIDLKRARKTMGEGLVAALILAKRLTRDARYGYVLAPESL